MLRVTIATLLAGACLAATAGQALAGTASVTSDGFQYLAAPGEVNDLSVTATSIGDPRVWEFTDTGGSPVLAGPGCAVADADTVVCTKPVEGPRQFDRLLVRLGDMDDSVTVANLCPDCEVGGGFFGPITLLGEAGADEITGGNVGGFNRLFGGEGKDTLVGGGVDEFFIGGPGSDSIDGGASEFDFTPDIASYEYSLVPVRVDFDGVADDGAPGENDTLVNIEEVWGSRFADVLVGDAGNNNLDGRLGPDLVIGGGGNDRLSGNRQSDIIKGGPGNDMLEGELGHDFILGGPGRDEITGGDMNSQDSFEGDVPDPNGKDVIRAGPGNDFIQGQGGADRIYGDDGDDFVIGQRGPDVLAGGRGRDSLTACFDLAVDRLFGGPGFDKGHKHHIDSARDIEDLKRCGVF